MTTAKVLEFPYSRIRLETEQHTAKILVLPAKTSGIEIWELPMVMMAAWIDGVFRVTVK
jgi:hypothetical protein